MAGQNCVDYATLAVDGAVTLLDDASPALSGVGGNSNMLRAKGAVITVETDQVRYREDGTHPTSAEGILLNVGDVLTYDSWTVPKSNWRSVLKALHFIKVTNAAKLKIHYYD